MIVAVVSSAHHFTWPLPLVTAAARWRMAKPGCPHVQKMWLPQKLLIVPGKRQRVLHAVFLHSVVKSLPYSSQLFSDVLSQVSLMYRSADLQTDWKQFPTLVIAILDYTQFYWESLNLETIQGWFWFCIYFCFPIEFKYHDISYRGAMLLTAFSHPKAVNAELLPALMWSKRGNTQHLADPWLSKTYTLYEFKDQHEYTKEKVQQALTLPACCYWQGHTSSIGNLPDYRCWKKYTANHTFCLIRMTWDNCYTSLGIWGLRFQKMNLKLPAALTNLSFQEKKTV